MNVSFSPKHQDLLSEKVTSGEFANADAVLAKALDDMAVGENGGPRRSWLGVPAQSDADLSAAVDRMRSSCEANRLGDDLTLRDLIEAGRKH